MWTIILYAFLGLHVLYAIPIITYIYKNWELAKAWPRNFHSEMKKWKLPIGYLLLIFIYIFILPFFALYDFITHGWTWFWREAQTHAYTWVTGIQPR